MSRRGSRLSRNSRMTMADIHRLEIVAQMTPSEIEFAEERFGKPISKFSKAELQKEIKEIKKTYPEEMW